MMKAEMMMIMIIMRNTDSNAGNVKYIDNNNDDDSNNNVNDIFKITPIVSIVTTEKVSKSLLR